MTKRRRPRQSDVAQLAGVSQTAVSAVLNNRTDVVRVSEETRQRILDAAQELGYVANPAARSLAGGQNYLMGIFTYEPIFPFKHYNFYYPFLVGIEEEAEARGYDLLLFTSVSMVKGRRRIYQDNANRLHIADGAVLLGIREDKNDLARLLDEGFPFVFVGRREIPEHALSYVAADYAQATAEVTTHLIEHGHRRIAYIGILDPTEPQHDREAGYHLAHQRLDLPADPTLVRRINPDDLRADHLLACLATGVTAFVLEDLSFEPFIWQAAQSAGKRIPDDFSLAILNPPTNGAGVRVTGFDIPRSEMGAHAVRLLDHILSYPDEPEPHHETLPCKFMPGDTVAAPPNY